MPEFRVHQSLWGMIDLPRGGEEWSIHEKLDRVAEAGFEGVEFDHSLATGEAERLGPMARERGLGVSINMIAGDEASVRREYEWAMTQDPDHISLQPFGAYLGVGEGAERVAIMQRVGREFGLEPTIETHRDRLTWDIVKTVAIAQRIPDLRFTVDLSHWVLAAEQAHNDREDFEAMIQRILERTGHFHGRVSNGEQIQIDIGDGTDCPDLGHFMRWWREGMRQWRQQMGDSDGAVLRYVVELGPYPYSPRAVDAGGAPVGEEFSDRWSQALVFQRLARKCWNSSLS